MQRQSKRAPEGVLLLLLLFFLFPSFDKLVKKLAGGYVKQHARTDEDAVE